MAPPDTTTPTLLTSAEARAVLYVSQPTFSRLVKAGKLTPYMRAGSGVRSAMLFRPEDVEALAAERAAAS